MFKFLTLLYRADFSSPHQNTILRERWNVFSKSILILFIGTGISYVSHGQAPCCTTGNQMPNGSFETETPGATWNTTFSGAEAMWMPKNIINQLQNPANGWFVGTDVTVNEANKIGGFYIRNNNGNGDPADGTHYVWVRGYDSTIKNSVCMQIYLNNIGIAAPCKRYELCFKAAAWNPDGAQGNAEIAVEWFYQTPGGAFPIKTNLLLAPANTSDSFNDLNWNTYTVNFEIPSNYSNWFGVAISSHENIDGVCIDDVCIKEVGVAQLACLPPSPFVSAQSAVTCNGGNNGCATIDNLNGGFPWAFLWNDGNTNGSRCGLSAGTYTVTVTDNTGATGTVNVTITQPSALVTTCSHTDVTTNGGSDGTASVVASGGTGALTYLWSNGNSNATMSGLSVGTYTVTVTDANGCTQSCSALVVQPAVVPCCVTGNQMPNGSFETETPGALWNTTFSGAEAMWMPKNVISQAQNPNNGWFVGTDVTVNEAAKIGGFYIRNNNGNGDPADGTHFTWVRGRNESINNNVCMQIYLNNIGIAASCKRYELCFKAAAWNPDGPQGNAEIGIEWFYQTPGGAFPVLTQLLLAPANTSGSFNDLNWNTYTTVFEIPSNYGNFFGVAISSHENIDGVCIDDVCIKEVGPAQTACLPPSPFVSSQSNVTCSGGNNGCATIDNLNGGFPFTYLWSDGNTNASRCGLAAGTYTATVTDNTGATGTVNVTIAQPTSITATCSGTDVTTPGGSNGTASVTASGGTGALSYLWSNANTNASMSGLSAGTYTVTVTDANGCTQTCSTTILEPTCNITIGALVKDVICNGGADATIDVTVAGANGAISYLWNDGNTNEDRAGLSIGTFTVTVTDAANCTNTASFAISEPIILGMSAIPTNVSTNGGSDGSVNVTTSGGTSPYSFLWNDGDTNEDRTNLAAGTYTATVTDDNGCTAILSVTLYEPLSVTCAGVDPSSVGANDGSVTTVVVGGLAGYTYIWSNGDTSNDLGAVAAGTYTVTVTDILGNTSTCQTTLVDPFGILCAGVDVTTNGGSDGSANVTATGGVSPFTYLWSNGSTGTVISGIGAGVYTITVTDNSNSTLSCIVTINEPTCNEVVSGLVIDVLCNGGTDASIDVTVTGANGTVTYLWNDGNTNEDRTGLAAGTYTVTATDAAGCIETATFTVTEPALLGMSGTPTDVTTNGGNNGSIDVTATGGTPAYTYLWNDGDTNEDRSGLTAGTYTVTVTDANGCTEEATFTINEPGCNEVVSGVVIDVLCNGGTDASIDVTVTGANGTVTYLWNDGDTNEDRTGLSAGTYTVTATDAASCTEAATFTVTEPALLGMSGTPTDVTTNGGNNGSIDVTATGGTPAYTYVWNDGDTNEDRTNLSAGTYTVTVTDANGCTEEATFTINEPGCNEVVSGVVIDVLCNGGTDASIDVTVTGANGTVTYLWNDGNTNEDRTGLAAGTYTVTATDAAGCIETGTFTVTEPAVLSMNGTPTDVTTNGGNNGSIDVTATGGTPAYTYLWNDGDTNEDRSGLTAGTYTVTVTDANGCTEEATFTINEPGCNEVVTGVVIDVLCNGGTDASIDVTVTGANGTVTYLWNDGDTNEDRTGLSAGTYTVTATDAAGCIETATFTVTEPALLGMNGTPTDVTTNGGSDGSIDVTATGGTPAYTYVWNDGDTNEDRSGLTAGTYTVTVTDANGCTEEATFTINEPGCNEVVSGVVIDVLCNGGTDASIDVTVTGANGTVTYLWNDGDTNEDRTGLSAGTYTVTATDAAGCIETATFTVTEPALLGMNGTPTDVTTNGGSDGSIDVTATGGTPAYTYLWNDGDTNEDRSGLTAGTYTVTVTDANGCTEEATFTINEPGCNEVVSGLVIDVLCNGGTDASIDVTVTGNNGAVTYLWNDGDTNEDRTGLSAGTYTVTATDAAGCIETATFTVTEPALLGMSGTPTDVTTNGGSDGSIDVTATGGTPNYTYLWSNGSTDEDQSNLPAGTYTVTVTDANGCTEEATFTINEPGCNEVVSGLVIDVLCNGGTDASIDVTVTGNNGAVTYLWNDGDTNEDRTGLAAGTYTVTATDAAGCIETATFTVTEPALLGMNGTPTDVTTNGGSDGSIDVTATGGTPNYTYLWSNGSTDEDQSNLPAGTYTVTVTDANGCTEEATFTINEPGCNEVVSGVVIDVLCNGGTDASIDVTVTGNNGA
ncbi:MAG: hypothetical protein IPO27_13815 [Bacteroidetes bacterium]|nr:hypothetical protein [Bacteroidota bacterium]